MLFSPFENWGLCPLRYSFFNLKHVVPRWWAKGYRCSNMQKCTLWSSYQLLFLHCTTWHPFCHLTTVPTLLLRQSEVLVEWWVLLLGDAFSLSCFVCNFGLACVSYIRHPVQHVECIRVELDSMTTHAKSGPLWECKTLGKTYHFVTIKFVCSSLGLRVNLVVWWQKRIITLNNGDLMTWLALWDEDVTISMLEIIGK